MLHFTINHFHILCLGIFRKNSRQTPLIRNWRLDKIGLRKEKKLSKPESSLTFRKTEKERTNMSNNNNQLNIPQAREAMDKFKMQAASEVGVNLTNGYNGHLTSREAGSVGGQMVKNVCPGRTKKFERISRVSAGYVQKVAYITAVTV